jgi:cyclopropane-fatty-acyl-phospholipid synthase
MDVVTTDNPAIYEGFGGMALVRLYERLRHWLRGNTKTPGQARTSPITTISATISTGSGSTTA